MSTVCKTCKNNGDHNIVRVFFMVETWLKAGDAFKKNVNPSFSTWAKGPLGWAKQNWANFWWPKKN